MEFMIPVKYTGVCYHRVQAENLEQAMFDVAHKANVKASFELPLSEVYFDMLAPRLMLTDEQLETWPYWEYGYHGTDGSDWRVHYTSKGRGSIPDYAEEWHPVPADWIESFKSERGK